MKRSNLSNDTIYQVETESSILICERSNYDRSVGTCPVDDSCHQNAELLSSYRLYSSSFYSTGHSTILTSNTGIVIQKARADLHGV